MLFDDSFTSLEFVLLENKNLSEMNRCIAVAERIISSSAYANLNMRKVDQFVKNPTAFFRSMRRILKFPTAYMSFERTFLALAAPSLEGKTQTAFTLRNAYPLYFVMGAGKSFEGGLQSIYEPFAEQSKFLYDIAGVDLFNIRQNGASTQTNELLTKHNNTSFLTLGFFLKIMKLTEMKLLQIEIENDPEPFNWMRFTPLNWNHSLASLFPFQSLSRNDKSSKKTFCLFLDEFTTDPWSVFIRSLAQAAGLVCIVSNTNTNVANLMVKRVETSRTEGLNNCWALVFSRLDNVALQVLVSPSDHDFKAIKDHFSRSKLTSCFFDQLFGIWLSRPRPGIAVLVLKALKNLSKLIAQKKAENTARLAEIFRRKRSFASITSPTLEAELLAESFDLNSVSTLEGVLQYVIKSVSSELTIRKRRMVSKFSGKVAKLGLLIQNAYSPDDDSFTLFHYIRFLENHLYYLLNAIGTSLDFFLAFTPAGDNEYLRMAWHNYDGIVIDKDWDLQFTTFRNDEIFTFLASVCLKLDCAPNFILDKATKENMSDSAAIASLPNSNAIKLSGNHLEISAAMTCMDASHHSSGLDPIYSFAGQDGFTWLTKVLANCSFEKETFRTKYFTITAKGNHFDLENYLRSTRIPFLYGVNHRNSWLEELSDGLDIWRANFWNFFHIFSD